jgi:3-deoxy-7-phosphoheptulonate synthase
MMVIMKQGYEQEEMDAVMNRLKERQLAGHPIIGVERAVIAVVGHIYPELRSEMEAMPGVAETVRISVPYKLASRETKQEDTVVRVRGGAVEVGSGKTVVIAGPCAVEDEQLLMETARAVRAAGGHMLRGGAYKPRTSPYSFRGMELEGLRLLAQAREETGLPVVTEVLSVHDIENVAEYSDVLQIGTRNAQNYTLVEEVAKVGKPVLLKRGLASSVEDWLLAAEYILNQGNQDVIMCERGIRTFETATRNTVDINAIPLIKQISHLPVIADPSHGTGKRSLVAPVARAAIAAGADGVMVEVHPNPEKALSDGPQSLDFEHFGELMGELQTIGQALQRSLWSATAERAPA